MLITGLPRRRGCSVVLEYGEAWSVAKSGKAAGRVRSRGEALAADTKPGATRKEKGAEGMCAYACVDPVHSGGESSTLR